MNSELRNSHECFWIRRFARGVFGDAEGLDFSARYGNSRNVVWNFVDVVKGDIKKPSCWCEQLEGSKENRSSGVVNN